MLTACPHFGRDRDLSHGDPTVRPSSGGDHGNERSSGRGVAHRPSIEEPLHVLVAVKRGGKRGGATLKLGGVGRGEARKCRPGVARLSPGVGRRSRTSVGVRSCPGFETVAPVARFGGCETRKSEY